MKQIVESICIVDDDGDDRKIIHDAFRQTGTTAEIAQFDNGNAVMEHLNKLESNKLPTLILLDLNMPGKDGREVLQEIKAINNFRHIPIVIFTTSSYDHDRKNCYLLGANCFVTKPSAYNKLVESIQSIGKLWLSDTMVKSFS